MGLVMALAACAGASKSPENVACASGPRVALDCASEISYQGVKASGGVHVLAIGASASIDERALRAVNEQVERYVATQTRLCREYNSCIIDADRYHAEAKEGAERLTSAGELARRIEHATTSVDVARASDALYETFVPANRRVDPLDIRMTIEAELPTELGAGKIRLPPNHPVPTGARLAFLFELSRTAFLYLFQVDAKNHVEVLFPDTRMASGNPLPGGAATRIPPGALTFRVDDRGVGLERVYIVVSSNPVPDLDRSLARFASGREASIATDPLLADIGSVRPGATPPCSRARDLVLDAGARSNSGDACPRSRGLVLDDATPPTGTVAHSMAMRTAAGDDTVIKVFPFQHVPANEYRAAVATFSAPTPEGARARRVVVEK